MKRRWFIRICFMLPILLCVVGWVWSGWYNCSVDYSRVGRNLSLGTNEGAIYLDSILYTTTEPSEDDGWGYTIEPQDDVILWPRPNAEVRSFIGFQFYHPVGRMYWRYRWSVPFWFLIVGFSAVLFVVWRKTGKPKPGRAFPVEAGNRNGSAGG